MASPRQRILASILRRYPFCSGCATLANARWVTRIAGAAEDGALEWACVPGGRVLCPLTDYVGRAAYYVGDLDRKLSRLCRCLVRPGDVALDIGANIGVVSVLLSSLVGRDGRVLAVEPNPSAARLLEASIRANGRANVELHRVALGAADASMPLVVPRGNAGAASLKRDAGAASDRTRHVPVRRLDDLARERHLETIHFVKIDVEGFEHEVLLGATHTLSNVRPRAILFEQNEPIPPAEHPVFRLLADADYGFFAIPRTLLRLRLEPFQLGHPPPRAHDYLAVPTGESRDRFAHLIKSLP